MDIKEMLKAGKSAEDIAKLFTDELNKAESEIRAEKAAVQKAKELEDMREIIAEDLQDYLELIGVDFSNDDDEKFHEEAINTLKNCEHTIKSIICNADALDKWFNAVMPPKATNTKTNYTKATTPKNDTDVIADFLKKYC